MPDDRGLVLSLLAAHLLRLPPDVLKELGGRLDLTPNAFAQFIEKRSGVSSEEATLLTALTDEAIRAFDNDAAAAAAALGGEERLAEFMGGTTVITPPEGTPTAQMKDSPAFLHIDDQPLGVSEAPQRYTRLSKGTRGGMGKVYIVHDKTIGRDVALKELLPPSDSSTVSADSPVSAVASMAHRFIREGRITAQLEHPAIVPVYEIGLRPKGVPYYTMKLVRGRTFGEALSECTNLGERLRLLPHFRDLCLAIAYAHSRGVIHRDIKPSNVMVGAFGETVVLDWGVAKLKRQEDIFHEEIIEVAKRIAEGERIPATAYGAVLGTPQYMSPEQAGGLVDEIDERSDVYSLGAVLYEMLTGRLPFEGEDVYAVLDAVSKSEPPSVTSIEPEAPPELAGICAKAMSKDRACRYPSAEALADEVERFQTGRLVGAYSYTSWELLRRFYRRNRRMVGMFAGAAAVIFFIAIYSYIAIALARDREREQRIQAQHDAYVAQIRLSDTYEERKEFAAAHTLLQRTTPQLRGWEWGFLWARCSQDLCTLRGHTGFLVDTSYSPTGDSILTVANDASAKLWNAATYEELHTFRAETGSITMGAFSPDGASIAFGLTGGGVRIFDAQSYAETARLEGHAGRTYSVAFSPDGRRLATASADNTVGLWDVPSAARLSVLQGHSGEVKYAGFSHDGRYVFSVGSDGFLMLWNGVDGEKLAEFEGKMGQFNPQAEQFLYWTGQRAEVLDIQTLKPAYVLDQFVSSVNLAEFSPTGQWLGTGTQDGTVRLWTAATGAPGPLFNLGEPVSCLRVSSDDALVAACSREGLIRVWDIASGRLLVTHTGHGAGVATVRFSPDGSRLVSASFDQTARVWDSRRSRLATVVTSCASPVTGVDMNADGSRIASIVRDNAVRVVEVSGGRTLFHAAMRRGAGGTCVALSPDGEYVAAALDGFVPMTWRVSEGTLVTRLDGHDGRVAGIAFSPDGREVATASWDGKVRVWGAGGGSLLRSFGGTEEGMLTRVVFSPDGRLAATGSYTGRVCVYDANTGRCLSRFTAPDAVLSVAFAHQSPLVAAACEGGAALVWDYDAAEQRYILEGHRSLVTGVAFSRDDARAVTASWDRKIRVWDGLTGEQYIALPALASQAVHAAFLPDGGKVVTADYSGDLMLWNAFPWKAGTSEATAGSTPGGAEDIVAAEPAPEDDRTRTAQRLVVVVEREVGLNWLRDLYVQLEANEQQKVRPEGGLLLEPSHAVRYARLALLPGDAIEAVGEAKMEDTPAAMAALAPFRLDTAPSNVPAVTIRRGNERFSVVYQFLPSTVLDSEVVLTRDEALMLLKEARTRLQEGLDSVLQTNHELSSQLGEPLAGRDRLNGFWLEAPVPPQEKPLYQDVGLSAGDRITAVNGQSISSISQLNEMLEEAMQAVASGKTGSAQLRVERGDLTILNKTIVAR